MVQVQENRYNKSMVYTKLFNRFLILFIAPIMLASCATVNNLMNDGDESSSEIKEISLNKRLQISIPIPENSKYVTDKTIIFVEVSRFTVVF